MEVSGEREELNQVVNANMMQKNAIAKGSNMARAGNIREAQAIMKGFKRQAKKNLAPGMQEAVMQNYSEQVQEVYGALNNAADSEGEEELEQIVQE